MRARRVLSGVVFSALLQGPVLAEEWYEPRHPVDAVDVEQGAVLIADHAFRLSPEVRIRTGQGVPLRLEDLRPGDHVRMRVAEDEAGRAWVVEVVRMERGRSHGEAGR